MARWLKKDPKLMEEVDEIAEEIWEETATEPRRRSREEKESAASYCARGRIEETKRFDSVMIFHLRKPCYDFYIIMSTSFPSSAFPPCGNHEGSKD